MIEVVEVKPTENPEVVKVEFVQVQTALDIARGFGKAKRHWETANAKTNTFEAGQKFPNNIKMVQHDEPQYEGHKPFEKTGKYYTSELV